MAGSWRRILGGRECEAGWRPIQFTAEVPAKLICDLCGMLPFEMATLSCEHRMCTPCMQWCVFDGGYCPLHVASVRVRRVSLDKNLERAVNALKVYCWNRENGCTEECRVEALQEHFLDHCNYHVTSCFRCQTTVLLRCLPKHLRAGCAGQVILPAGVSSREGVVASIQAGLSGLLEGVNRLNLRTSDANERGVTGSLEQGVRELYRSARRFVGNSQDACTAAVLAEISASGANGQGDASGTAEDRVVLKLLFNPFDSEYPYDLWKDDTFTLRILGELTNVEIQILMSSIANSVGLFAKVSGPGPWCMPDIEPLPSDYRSALPSTAWIQRTLGSQSERPTDSAIDPSYSLRCMVGLPPPVPKEMFELTCLKFLIKLRKG